MNNKARSAPVRKEPANRWRAEAMEWGRSLVTAFLLAMVVRHFLFQAFKIPSCSMEPTLQVRDHLIANKIIYRFREPSRGQVVIFRFPDPEDRRDFVKRLVGLPGETLAIRDGRIYINGELADEPRLADFYYYGNRDFEIEIPPEKFFVLGDNSGNSYDSRFWGFVPRSDMIGVASFIYWPPDRWGAVR